MTQKLIVKYRGMIATLCLLLLMATMAVAQSTGGSDSSGTVPQLVRFTGVLKDNLDHVKTGIVGVTFGLYKEQDGGSPLWLEMQNVEAEATEDTPYYWVLPKPKAYLLICLTAMSRDGWECRSKENLNNRGYCL